MRDKAILFAVCLVLGFTIWLLVFNAIQRGLI